jgi:hypothetical protein
MANTKGYINKKKNLSVDYGEFFWLNISLVYTERITMGNEKNKTKSQKIW